MRLCLPGEEAQHHRLTLGIQERLPSSWEGAASWDRADTRHRRLQDGPAGRIGQESQDLARIWV